MTVLVLSQPSVAQPDRCAHQCRPQSVQEICRRSCGTKSGSCKTIVPKITRDIPASSQVWTVANPGYRHPTAQGNRNLFKTARTGIGICRLTQTAPFKSTKVQPLSQRQQNRCAGTVDHRHNRCCRKIPRFNRTTLPSFKSMAG